MTEREIANKYFENVAKIQYGVTTAANESYAITKVTFDKLHCSAKRKEFPVKIQGDYYNFDIAESEYDNQSALPPTSVKGEGIQLQNYFCNKKVAYWFLITIYSIK
jgi:hypothetical protein